jgi:ABC-type sugar transport system substrate-binding protein
MEIHEIDLTEEPDDAIRQVKAAVRRSTRAIIITPFENDELQKQLKKAREKGISLIYLDAVQSYEIPGTLYCNR